MRFLFRHCLDVAAFMLLSFGSLAFGASVSITSSGNGIFNINGENMDGVTGIELVLNHDASLTSPKVTQGGLTTGAIFLANPKFAPKAIKIAVISSKPFSGSGPIATVSFASLGGAGSVTVASSSMIDSSGSPVTGAITNPTASGFISSPGIPFSQPAASTTTSSSSTTTGSSGAAYLGTISMPTDATPTAVANEPPVLAAQPEASATLPTEHPPTSELASKTDKNVETVTTSHQSVLERFRAYQGEKSPAILIALFKKAIAPSFHQEPFVAIADGKTIVKIVVDHSATNGRSTNFALNDSKLMSLKKNDAASKWLIETFPVANALKASLLVLNDYQIIEYPLTIAPQFKDVAATEADFATYLKKAATAPAKHDLNNDGKYDGADDYIYTANFLARQELNKAKSVK
ncbi:MAG: hypothetical protein ACYDG4_01975 [Desulfuromonadaceae bacterium]